MSVRVPIRGVTLEWARTAMGISAEELAKSAAVKPGQIEQWEAGDAVPTLPQLRKVAHHLERTIAFFLTDPPASTGVPAMVDFRGASAGTVPSVVRRETKRAEHYRDTTLELDGAPDSQLQLQPFDKRTLVDAAAAVRQQLLATIPDRKPRTPGEGFNRWREALEHLGVLVFQSTGVPRSTYRGLSVFHEHYPIILVNGADAANGKIFTLFHELGHLSNRSSGMCVEQEDGREESLCNAFAAEVLMPTTDVRRRIARGSRADMVRQVVMTYGVSTLAAAIRLHSLQLIDTADLQQVRLESDDVWQRERDQLSAAEGHPPYATLRYRDLGPTYVGRVMRALHQNRVDYLEASYMLGAKIPTVEKLEQEYQRRGSQ
jgi:Zn-dependent peptidase ImmA (M78 family)/transcriptional regulator with XRE-family HTH domain